MNGLNVVLVEPEIPQNTGNIVRTCGSVGAHVHLVRPLGFEITDSHLKRAGLDYWNKVDISYYNSFAEVAEEAGPQARFYFFTTKGQKRHSDIDYRDGDYLVFGKETKGLPEDLLAENYESCVRIPMNPDFRSLNLGNSVAIALYEAMRQLDYEGMEFTGHLTGEKYRNLYIGETESNIGK